MSICTLQTDQQVPDVKCILNGLQGCKLDWVKHTLYVNYLWVTLAFRVKGTQSPIVTCMVYHEGLVVDRKWRCGGFQTLVCFLAWVIQPRGVDEIFSKSYSSPNPPSHTMYLICDLLTVVLLLLYWLFILSLFLVYLQWKWIMHLMWCGQSWSRWQECIESINITDLDHSLVLLVLCFVNLSHVWCFIHMSWCLMSRSRWGPYI